MPCQRMGLYNAKLNRHKYKKLLCASSNHFFSRSSIATAMILNLTKENQRAASLSRTGALH